MATNGAVDLKASNQPEPVPHEATVTLLYLDRALILRDHVGEGSLGDETVNLSLGISQPAGSLIVEYRKRYVAIDLESYIRAAAELDKVRKTAPGPSLFHELIVSKKHKHARRLGELESHPSLGMLKPLGLHDRIIQSQGPIQ